MAADYLRDLGQRDLARYTGSMDQLAGIKLLEAADGNERGNRVLEAWTGSGLVFHILADRALDISTCHYKGMSLAWKSSVGDVHPAYYDPHGIGWLRSFQGGMLVTCGLDTFGPPSLDADEELGQHGRASNLPAKAVAYSAGWREDGYHLEISGEARQTRVFGENLVLRRHISTRMGSNTIRIDDRVTNEGFSAHPHMILYHINTGFPLLSEHARLKVDVRATLPADENTAAHIQDWAVFQPPTPGFREQNFIHTPVTDERGWGTAEMLNPRLGLGLRLRWDAAGLPYMNEWKMMGEGLYVTAIEPMNSIERPGGRAEVRQRKSLPHLEAGQSVDYALELEVVELA